MKQLKNKLKACWNIFQSDHYFVISENSTETDTMIDTNMNDYRCMYYFNLFAGYINHSATVDKELNDLLK